MRALSYIANNLQVEASFCVFCNTAVDLLRVPFKSSICKITFFSAHCISNHNPSPDHYCSHLLVRNAVGRKGGQLLAIILYYL